MYLHVSVCVCVCCYLLRVTIVKRTNPSDRIIATKLSIHEYTAPPLTALIRHEQPRSPYSHSLFLLPSNILNLSFFLCFFVVILLISLSDFLLYLLTSIGIITNF